MIPKTECLRLTELHEEWGAAAEAARRTAGADTAFSEPSRTAKLAGEIRRRVAEQPLLEDPLPLLRFGVPDAERKYPRRNFYCGAPFEHWVNHAAHFRFVESCDLCRAARTLAASRRKS